MTPNPNPLPIETADDVAEWLIDGGLPAVMAVQLADSSEKFTFTVKGDTNSWWVHCLELHKNGTWYESCFAEPRMVGEDRPAFIAG